MVWLEYKQSIWTNRLVSVMFYDNRFMKNEAQRHGKHSRSRDVYDVGFLDEFD